MTSPSQPTSPSVDALIRDLEGFHDCADGDVAAGNGHFRLECISDSNQQRLNLRAVLREAAEALRVLSAPRAPDTNPSVDAETLAERIAQWLHDETEHPDSYPDYTWPETERDDGQREGAFVKIVPKHAQAYFRDIARRLITQFPALSAPRVEPVAYVSAETIAELAGPKCGAALHRISPIEVKGYDVPLYAAPPSQPDTGVRELVDAVQALLSDKSVTYAVRCNRVVKALAALPPDAGSRKPALDPATVEACAKEAEVWQGLKGPKLADKIRALANCGEPVAWMNSGHIEAYQSGKRDGMAWASPLESDFYSVALYAAPAPSQPDTGVRDLLARVCRTIKFVLDKDEHLSQLAIDELALALDEVEQAALPPDAGSRKEA